MDASGIVLSLALLGVLVGLAFAIAAIVKGSKI